MDLPIESHHPMIEKRNTKAQVINITIRGDDFEPDWHHGETAFGILSDYQPGTLREYDGQLVAALVYSPERKRLIRRVGVILYAGTQIYFDTHSRRLAPRIAHEDNLVAIGILGKTTGQSDS